MSQNSLVPISGITQQLESMALHAYEMRHRVIAHNIANADSIGFQPLRLNFEDQLGALRAALKEGQSAERLSELIGQIQPKIEVDVGEKAGVTQPGENLDDQLVALTQNTLDYEAMLTVVSRLGSLSRLAITGS